jgi:hypothetical protein
MQPPPQNLLSFVKLSKDLCGITELDLWGTGQVKLYYHTVADAVTEDRLKRLLVIHAAIPFDAGRVEAIRSQLIEDPEFGPICQRIIVLFLLAEWFALPASWSEIFGRPTHEKTGVPSPYAFPEALLWPAVGAHPPGAKPGGYNSWSSAPVCLPIPS